MEREPQVVGVRRHEGRIDDQRDQAIAAALPITQVE